MIPSEILEAAIKAQKTLETLAKDERKEFIDKNSQIWRNFAAYLSKMSYGKCWYTESPEYQSFFDVDHYRPKKRAKRSTSVIDDGYPWLAFSWENFRCSASRSNRLNTNEETEEIVGKGDWFPLLPGSVKADWHNRCESQEKPVLLDPTVKSDVDLIQIDDSGRVCPSFICSGQFKKDRVNESIKIYGLNLPRLVGARMKKIREITNNYQTLT